MGSGIKNRKRFPRTSVALCTAALVKSESLCSSPSRTGTGILAKPPSPGQGIDNCGLTHEHIWTHLECCTWMASLGHTCTQQPSRRELTDVPGSCGTAESTRALVRA